MHGDYRMDNLIFVSGDEGRVAGVLDWELATLGDGFCDLAYVIPLITNYILA